MAGKCITRIQRTVSITTTEQSTTKPCLYFRGYTSCSVKHGFPKQKLGEHIEGILPKGPYLPCVSMAGGALLAGYPRYDAMITSL